MIHRIIAIGALILFCAYSYAQSLRTSVQSGNWSSINTWDCTCVPAPNDHAIVVSGHVVTLSTPHSITDLTIAAGATLTDHGLANTITGNLLLNGTYSGSGVIRLTGENTIIDGVGVISNSANIQVTGNKTIPTTARLTINSSTLSLQGAYTITNYGTITVGGNITGSETASTWINETNSTLNIGGTSGVPLLSTGTLHAYAPGNTVNYYATYAHTLKLPSVVSGYSTYHHLKISGTNTKTLPNGEVAVNGDLTINSTFSGSGTNKKLFLRGHWINNGNFTEGTGEGTITFDGTGDQYITRAATENMNVIVINKSSGKVVLFTNLIAERGITMLAGDIDVKTYTLTLGLDPSITGTLSWTSGTIIGKFERWISSTAIPIIFPIGSSDHHLPATIQFNTLSPGSLIGEFITTTPGNTGLPLAEDGVTLYNTFRDGYWSMTTANALATDDFTLDLTANGFSGFTINDQTRLLTRAAASLPWDLNGSHLIRVNNTIRRTNMSILSGEYSLGDDTNCAAPQTSVIAGTADVCKNASGMTYTVANNSFHTYTWMVKGGTITSGNGTNSISVDWGSEGIVGTVSVVENNVCTAGAKEIMVVNVHSLAPVSITGKTNVPQNGIMAETYSIAPIPDYSYTWTVTGGSIAAGQGSSSITVNWGNEGTGSVCVLSQHSPSPPASSCGMISSCTSIAIYNSINTKRSGNWQNMANWDCTCVPGATDNVTINNTHSISLSGSGMTANHVTINAGGLLNINSNTLTVQGDFTINGIVSGTGNILLNGLSTKIDGVGAITTTGPLTLMENKEILPATTLTKIAGSVDLGPGVAVTNKGTITLGGSITGGDMDSQWINDAHATLNISGEVLTTGKLFASANNNTIRYFGTTSQPIKVPEAQQYTNLIISDTGAKTAPAVLRLSGNFSNDGNFQHNNGTVIFNGNTLVAGNALTTFNHLTSSSGSSLTFPSGFVQVAGDINFESGSLFDSAHGTVVLSGTADQQLDVHGANFYTLQVNKAGGMVNVKSAMPILHRLDFQSPTTFNTNDQLIIKSRGITTDLDGSIGALPAGNLILGKVTVERYTDPIGRTFRYLASPVADALLPSVLGTTIHEYVYSSGIGNWKRNSSISPLVRSKGYAVLVPGYGNPITWSVSGPIQQGTFTWNFNEEGWHLIGNPFPSSIRWQENPLAWELTNVSTIMAVTDNSIVGYPNYFRYWSFDHANNPEGWNVPELQNGVVAMGQAFWVYVGAGGGLLTIHEGAKESSLTGEFYRASAPADNWLTMVLDDGQVADVAYLRLNAKANEDYDFNHDLKKLWNQEMNLYWIDRSENELVINALDKIEAGQKLPVGIEVTKVGDYTLSFVHAEKFRYGNQLYLIDSYEGIAVPIAEGRYTFQVHDANTSLNDRFYLSLAAPPEGNVMDVLEVYPNPVKEKVTIRIPPGEEGVVTLFDYLGGEVLSHQMKGLLEIDMSNYPGGMYWVQFKTTNGKRLTRKIVKR